MTLAQECVQYPATSWPDVALLGLFLLFALAAISLMVWATR